MPDDIVPLNRKPDQDAQFFTAHPDRSYRIRLPEHKECSGEFWSLGDHESSRRRIICWKVPRGNPAFGKILKVPFLAFADETIEDNDATLKPIMDQIMRGAAIKHGVKMR